MQDAAHTVLSLWENFYVIIGSSGAALTGLQFVVMALVRESSLQSSTREVDAFGTPTIVHFCTALLLSSVLSAPWRTFGGVALTVGATGLFGIAYTAIIIRRARTQTGYKPVFEDWLWHTALPLVSHIILVGAAIALYRGSQDALFPIAAVSLLLLFIGIHNAWDTVVFLALQRAPEPQGRGKPDE
jgi:hypothetical protein